jgi:hypothetical protein
VGGVGSNGSQESLKPAKFAGVVANRKIWPDIWQRALGSGDGIEFQAAIRDGRDGASFGGRHQHGLAARALWPALSTPGGGHFLLATAAPHGGEINRRGAKRDEGARQRFKAIGNCGWKAATIPQS